jgi:PIN domain nuclease of toxin-antitoxin system
VKFLLDTHVLLWASATSSRLPRNIATLIDDVQNTPMFSVASLWEVAIKRALGRDGFNVDPRLLRTNLLDHAYEELPILGEHAIAVGDLPPIHKDPFDRILVAQSVVEGITLLTSDPIVARYPGPIRRV